MTKTDIFNILAALEFCSRPGGVLSEIYDVSLTTISRIKHKISHNDYINEYNQLSLEERKRIYDIFCESSDFYYKKINKTIIKTNRKFIRRTSLYDISKL